MRRNKLQLICCIVIITSMFSGCTPERNSQADITDVSMVQLSPKALSELEEEEEHITYLEEKLKEQIESLDGIEKTDVSLVSD